MYYNFPKSRMGGRGEKKENICEINICNSIICLFVCFYVVDNLEYFLNNLKKNQQYSQLSYSIIEILIKKTSITILR